MQVFFVRDGMSFPDMVHALKPNPKNNIQEFWRIWDYFASCVLPSLLCSAHSALPACLATAHPP